MRPLLFSIALTFIASCSDNTTDLGSQPGTLDITTITNGPQPDADGYSVGLDGLDQGSIGLDATLRLEDVEAGDHALQLNGVADNCTVAGQNPRTVSVSPGGVIPVSFMVTCLGTLGGIEVSTQTTGANPDRDGYIVVLDGKDRLRIDPNGTTTFDGLALGTHSVGLSDIATNCQLQGENPRPVGVTGGATRTVAFRVSCT